MFRHENVLTEKVRSLERKLVKEQRETMRARATKARDAIERAEMEDFFMQCVEVRKASTLCSFYHNLRVRAVNSACVQPSYDPESRGSSVCSDTKCISKFQIVCACNYAIPWAGCEEENRTKEGADSNAALSVC